MTFSLASFAVPSLTRTSADPEIAVGTVVKGTGNSEFVYVQANGAIAQYDAVAVDSDEQAAPLSATNAITGVVIGVAQVAFADNEYGFVQTRGDVSVNVLASAAADVQLYATATAGSLDDAGTVSLQGIVLTETATGAGDVTANIGAGISIQAFS